MVERITARSFAPFGQVFEDSDIFQKTMDNAGFQGEKQTLDSATAQGTFMHSTAAVYLDYIEGMTVLCAYDSRQRQVRAYYLDKPVCLREGVPFCLVALAGQSTMRIFGDREAKVKPFDQPLKLPVLSVTPQLTVQRIHTLFFQDMPDGFYFRGEKHAAYELTYVDRGSIQCIVSGRKYTLHRHDMLLCLPGQWHIQYADPEVPSAFVTVSFDMHCEDAPSLAGRVHRATQEMRRHVETMLSAQRVGGVWSGDRILQAQSVLLLSMLDASAPAGTIAPRESNGAIAENHIVEEALRYIESHLYQPITVSMLAAGVCVSPSYLAVLFRRHLAMTPMEMLHKLKLEEAARLLRRGDLSISQVAQRLGFATLQHFSRCFKTYFGQGPREYVRSVRMREINGEGGPDNG